MNIYVLDRKTTATKAIRLKCEDCICDPLDKGTALDQITDCLATDCPLWEHRPLNSVQKALRKKELYERLTPEQRARADKKAELSRERLAKVRVSQE